MPTVPLRPALVRADIHERRSGVPDLLARLGVAVQIVALPAGDYAIGPAIVVERKSLPDFHETILKGRFWRQVDKLRHGSRWPFLLVEGRELDDGPIDPKAIRGICVAAIARGIRLIRTEDRGDSAMWLRALAIRVGRTGAVDRPIYAQRPPPRSATQASEAVLAAVPGISTTFARALLREFGSVAAVLAAPSSNWLKVPGVGPQRASALEETFFRSSASTRQPATPPRQPRPPLNVDGGR